MCVYWTDSNTVLSHFWRDIQLPAPLLIAKGKVEIPPKHPPFVGKGEIVLHCFTLMHRECLPPGAGVACRDEDSCSSLNPLLIPLIGEWVAKGLWEPGTSFGPRWLLNKIPTSRKQCPSSILSSSSFTFSIQLQQCLRPAIWAHPMGRLRTYPHGPIRSGRTADLVNLWSPVHLVIALCPQSYQSPAQILII